MHSHFHSIGLICWYIFLFKNTSRVCGLLYNTLRTWTYSFSLDWVIFRFHVIFAYIIVSNSTESIFAHHFDDMELERWNHQKSHRPRDMWHWMFEQWGEWEPTSAQSTTSSEHWNIAEYLEKAIVPQIKFNIEALQNPTTKILTYIHRS